MKVNFKKILPLFILLLILMVIPQAFAGDAVNSTADDSIGDVNAEDILTAEAEDTLSDGEDAIYISVDGNDKNSGNQSSPFATIDTALNVALDTGITDIYILNGTYKENSLYIGNSLNIRGIGDVTIDAEGIDRIFKIDGPYEVGISGITFINGAAPQDAWTADIHEVVWYCGGGAINIVDAYVTVEDCKFINNTADDFGGAINAEAENCYVKNCIFMNNFAGVFGGAIDFEADKGYVDNCTFIANDAGNGGAIGYIASAGTIINSVFEENTAENGAAIFIENSPLTDNSTNAHLIQNNRFANNAAIQQGGAIEVENQQMSENADWTKIDGNEFINNSAYNGGAISAYYGDAGIMNNLFVNNSAGYGGAIASISTTDSSYIIIGGIYLKNNRIINCTAEENGNAIYNMGYFGTAVNITFVDGKTVCSDGKAAILNVTVCDDMGNPISGSPIDFIVGGKATINPAGDLYEGVGTVRYVPRENGTFEISGIFTYKFNKNLINLVTGKIQVENAIADYFGTIHVSQSKGDDDNTGSEDSPVKTFNQAYVLATREGGSFDIVVNEGTYAVLGYTLSRSFNVTGIGNPVLDGKNQATLFSLYGAPDDEFHFTGLTFINGVADPSKYAGMNEGGAIFFKGGNLYLENDTFSHNSANDYGGAVHINKGMDGWGTFYRSFAYIDNCTFTDNLVNYYGGAISLYDSDVYVGNCNFVSNTAKKGGAISILNGMANLTVVNSTFTRNSASEIGGAIDAEALNTYNTRYFADISDSVFTSNTADLGGAVAAGDANITGCIFERNVAKSCGGAIFVNETFLGEAQVNQSEITHSIFSANEAPRGSAYYGTSVLINDNYWGGNFQTLDELMENNVTSFVTQNDELKWANIEIDGLTSLLAGDYEYTVKFVSNDGGDLNSSMPDYDLKVSNSISANRITPQNPVISHNRAAVTYSADELGNDEIMVYNDYNELLTSINVTVNVIKKTTLAVENASYPFNDNSKSLSATLKDDNGTPLSNKTVIFKIGNETYSAATDSNGAAGINVNMTAAGTFNVNVEFEGDGNYNPSQGSAALELTKVNTRIDISNQTFPVTSPSKVITVTLTDENNNPLADRNVTFTINGQSEAKITDNNGHANFNVSLPAGSYDLTAVFKGDDCYIESAGGATVIVDKEKSKITAPKKIFKKSAKSKKLKIKLKSESGKAIANKKVILKVNGKKYKAKTTGKGKATFKVKLTAKKTYKYSVKFKGDDNYMAAIAKSTVKIR